jgi:hypothetical protein
VFLLAGRGCCRSGSPTELHCTVQLQYRGAVCRCGTLVQQGALWITWIAVEAACWTTVPRSETHFQHSLQCRITGGSSAACRPIAERHVPSAPRIIGLKSTSESSFCRGGTPRAAISVRCQPAPYFGITFLPVGLLGLLHAVLAVLEQLLQCRMGICTALIAVERCMPRYTISCCCMLQLIWVLWLQCTQLAHASGSCMCCRLGTTEPHCYPRSLCVAVSALHAVRCSAVIPPQLHYHDVGSQRMLSLSLCRTRWCATVRR